MKLKKIAIYVAIVLAVLSVALCVIIRLDTISRPLKTPDPPANNTTSTPGGPENAVRVSTPYGDLFYQDQWVDFMEVEQIQTADQIKLVFQCSVETQKYLLFTLTIGGDDENIMIGTLTDAAGVKRRVCVQMHGLGELPELTANEKDRLYAMQEEINFVMQYLQ